MYVDLQHGVLKRSVEMVSVVNALLLMFFRKPLYKCPNIRRMFETEDIYLRSNRRVELKLLGHFWNRLLYLLLVEKT